MKPNNFFQPSEKDAPLITLLPFTPRDQIIKPGDIKTPGAPKKEPNLDAQESKSWASSGL